jgi:hypothetical protein
MMKDMQSYSVYADDADIIFDEEELDDSDVPRRSPCKWKTMHVTSKI